MKKLGFLFCVILAITAFAQTPLDGDHNLTIEIYDSPAGGDLLLSQNLGQIHFTDGNPDLDINSIVRSRGLDADIVYAQLIIDGERLSSERIAIELSSGLRREAEPMDEMDMGLIIGETGNDIAVRSDRMVVGAGDPNEKVTVEGAMSMEKQASPPTSSTGYGKIFVNDSDNELYFVRDDGTSEILSVDDGGAGGIVSIEGSDRDSSMIGRLRVDAGPGTEITETMEGDTGLILIRFTGDCESGCTSPPSLPPAIDGASLVCSGEPGTSYGVPPNPDATYYRWTLPTGSSIIGGFGTNVIHAVFGNADGDISVTAVNECGESAPRTKSITINRPTTPGSISGPTLVCRNQTGVSYNISTVPDATNYSWTVPTAASIVSGSTTPNITVNFGTSPGEVCVRTENSCGISEPVCITVDMTWTPSTPGSITGPTSICAYEAGVTFSISSVDEATTYNWSLPTGASITSGDGTESIDVTFDDASGDICVSAENMCGTSSERCISINVQEAPAISSSPSDVSVNEGHDATFSITATGDALTYQWQRNEGSGFIDITGATSTSYTETSTTLAMDGNQYQCIVTNSTCSPVTSTAATLTVLDELFIFSSHTFTNCGQTGRYGPDNTDCSSYYSGESWFSGFFDVPLNGYQRWVVPADATYRITCRGAEGGYSQNGIGYGAEIRGDFDLTLGDTLLIVVGQMGQDRTGDYDAGAGGGSFVALGSNYTTALPLIIAGGAGGDASDGGGADGGSPTECSTGHCADCTSSHLGEGGQNACFSSNSPGGGGFYSDGRTGCSSDSRGRGFRQGCIGGQGNHSWGGFGGGSGGCDEAGSGGGGYTGGTGADNHSPTSGGGGSYNDGANQSNIGDTHSGHGSVTIEKI